MANSEKNLDSVFKDTANAIREKKGTNNAISPIEFADEIASIETGVEPVGTINITQNGEDIDVTNKASVNVNVDTSYYLQMNYEDWNYRNGLQVVACPSSPDLVFVAPFSLENYSDEGIVRYALQYFVDCDGKSLYTVSEAVDELQRHFYYDSSAHKLVAVALETATSCEPRSFDVADIRFTNCNFDSNYVISEMQSRFSGGVDCYDLLGNLIVHFNFSDLDISVVGGGS